MSAESFKAEGVPEAVLARAGLAGTRPGRRRSTAAGRTRVSRDDVRQAIRQHKQFTLPQIQHKTGASRETVRAVIKELFEGGEVEDPGPDESHTGRRDRPPPATSGRMAASLVARELPRHDVAQLSATISGPA